MGTIPNGVQEHVLWNMDGRTWIEAKVRATDSLLFQRALERGWAKIIPADVILRLVTEVQAR